MTDDQSQSCLPAYAESLLKNTLQGKRDEEMWRLFPHSFVSLGSTSRPVTLPRGSRVFGTRAPTSGQLTGQDKRRLCILVVRLNQQKGWKVVEVSSMEGNKLQIMREHWPASRQTAHDPRPSQTLSYIEPLSTT